MIERLSGIVPPWLSHYGRRSLLADVLAGLILSILLVPQAMAYALLAGLPPEAGLYTAVVAPLVYAALGRSAFISVGPVALASLLVADAVGGSDLAPLEAATIVALEVGAMLLLLGFLRLGRLVNFVSEPALLGFTAAAAVLIGMSQLPALLGIDVARSGNLVEGVQTLIGAVGVHWPTLLLGTAALLLLLLGDIYAGPILWRLGVRPPWRLGLVKSVPLAVMVAAALAAAWLPAEIDRIEEPAGGLPKIAVPLDPGPWLSLLVPSAVVAIVVFVTGMAVAKSLSSRRRQSLDSSREALALGAANVAAGLTGGYATGVSLSRSALVYDCGARSPLATAFAGLVVFVVVLVGGPLIAMLPETALAALVMSAVFGLVKTREIRMVWRHSQAEGGVVALTALATLAFGVQWGLLAGAVCGIAAFMWISSRPRVTRVGSTDRPGIYRSIDRDGVEIDTLPVLVVRLDRDLYFGNVGYCEDRIHAFVAEHPEARSLLLDMRAVNDIDASGIRMLSRLLDNLEEKHLEVGFAVLQAPVERALASSGPARIAPHFLTIEEGVRELTERCAA